MYDAEKQRIYRKTHLEAIRKSAREWARRNKKPYYWNPGKRLSQQKYRLKHKERIAEKRRLHFRKKVLTDMNFRFRWLLRRRMSAAFRAQQTKKQGMNEVLLGCTIGQARRHIEKQFKDGMSWTNHGVWEIDHIMPLSLFDLTKFEEQKKAFHFTNLQPLMKEENRKKANKLMI